MLTANKDVKKLIEANKNYESHYWFGGEVVTFTSDKLPGYTLVLEANGDVRAYLYDKQTKEELVYVKDKSKQANFYHQMRQYLNDESLYQCIEDKHSQYALSIDNNNWWECYLIGPSKEVIDLGEPLNADLLSEAIQELIDMEDDIVEWIN